MTASDPNDEVAFARICFHPAYAGIDEIIDVEGFAARAGDQAQDSSAYEPSFVKLADRLGQEMGTIRIEVSGLAIQVDRHDADTITVVLLAIGPE